MMRIDIPHQCAKGIVIEEADRKPGGVGCQTEDVKRPVWVQLQFFAGKPLRQVIQGGAQILFRHGIRQIVAKQR